MRTHTQENYILHQNMSYNDCILKLDLVNTE